jgi:hypothetical protein
MTATPTPGLELQGSHARVHPPEHRPGAGTDQVKWSLSSRGVQLAGGSLYAIDMLSGLWQLKLEVLSAE